MKCINCGTSVFNKPLHRTNPKGQSDAGWMCEDCIKKNEPELYNNLVDSGELQNVNRIDAAINVETTNTIKCPKCGAEEIDAMTPRTVYACGSSDYDQRPNTFKQSEECKLYSAK